MIIAARTKILPEVFEFLKYLQVPKERKFKMFEESVEEIVTQNENEYIHNMNEKISISAFQFS